MTASSAVIDPHPLEVIVMNQPAAALPTDEIDRTPLTIFKIHNKLTASDLLPPATPA